MKKININFNFKNLSFDKKKIFFFAAFIFFFYLLYLSIPSLYDSGRVQKDLGRKLSEEFKLNFSLSTDINYRILPKPHFVIRDCEIIDDESGISNRIAEVQNLKIYISQKNLLNNEIEIKNVNISKANFFLTKEKFNFVEKFINNRFSNKDIKINKSKIFFKDRNEEVIFIYTIKDILLLLENDKDQNILEMNGKLFNIDNKLTWTKNFNSNKVITKITAKEIFMNLINENLLNNEEYENSNNLDLQSNKFRTQYSILDDRIKFNSKKSIIKKTPISYSGDLYLNPFNLYLNIKTKELDLNYFFKNLNLLNEVLISNLLFKKNLYAEIKIDTGNVSKAKIFTSANININFQGGGINFNESVFKSKKIGNLKFTRTAFDISDKAMLLKGISEFNINDINSFYKTLLIPKKNRIEFNLIKFNFELNLKNGLFKIKKISFYDSENKIINQKVSEEIIEKYQDDEFSYLNSIQFRNFLKEFFINFAQEG